MTETLQNSAQTKVDAGSIPGVESGGSTEIELSFDKAEQGRSYLIVSNNAAGRNRMRMDSLGLIPGDVVHVLFRNFAGFVVAIKGSRLALSRSLASCLTVKCVHEHE